MMTPRIHLACGFYFQSENVSAAEEQFSESSVISGTPVSVFLTIVPVFFTTFLTTVIIYLLKLQSVFSQFAMEFGLVVFNILFNITLWNKYIGWVAYGWMFFTCLVAHVCLTFTLNGWIDVTIKSRRPGYITLARSSINLITVACILGDDFKMFPAHLVKSDSFGFGLMDTGIGLFVFGAGIVSKRQSLRNYKKILLYSLQLIALGIARTFILKQIGYPEKEREYGTHWNAFLTLGFTRIFAFLIEVLAWKNSHIIFLAIGVGSLHEIILQNGLASFALNSSYKRDTFLEANREGITSVLGFVALYLASLAIGFLFQTKKIELTSGEFLKNTFRLAVISAFLWKMVYVLDGFFGVSRRICNMGYVVWTLSIGTTMTTLFMLLELFCAILMHHRIAKTNSRTYVPLIMDAINFNGLGFFLLANVSTGFVNIFLQPNRRSNTEGILIMSGYLAACCTVATLLYLKNIKLKI